MMTDPIADLLTRIRNIKLSGHAYVEVPSSRMKKSIAAILKREGYIKDYEYLDDGKQGILKIYMKPKAAGAITGLKRISKPGLGFMSIKIGAQGSWRAGSCLFRQGLMTVRKPVRPVLAAK